MRLRLLLLSLFLAAVPAAAQVLPRPAVNIPASKVRVSGLTCTDLQCALDNGEVFSIDRDHDGLWEDAVLWDADGDGSTLQTCTAKDLPVPECKIAGEKVYPDAADDLNCAIHGCGHGKMENDGTIRLLAGVVYVVFPCWDWAAWDADTATPTSCPATGINDPRATCQAGGTDTRWNSSSGDAAVFADCPVDADGYKLMVVSTQDWQGTIEGGGVDVGPNDTGKLTTGGRSRGTTLAIDTGNEDTDWFLATGGFVRAIQMGRFNFGVPSTAPNVSHGGGSTLTTGSKGWGSFRSSLPFQVGQEGVRGTLCVCDSATSCDGQAAIASADGWVASLADGDLLTTYLLLHPATTISAPVTFAVDGAGSAFTQGSCPSGAKEILVGKIGESVRPQAIPWGFLSNEFGASISHERPSSFAAYATIRDVTVEPQDWYGETGGDCAKTGAWTVGADATSRDADCDTHPLFALIGNGVNTLEDLAIKNWHMFAIDGGPHPGKSYLRRLQFWYGHGAGFTDDSLSWEWEDLRIQSSYFTGGPFGGFFAYTKYNGLEIINSTMGDFATFGYGNQGIEFRKLRFLGSQFRHAFTFACGAINNLVEDVQIYGRRELFEGQEFSAIEFDCGALYTNATYCSTRGMLQDRGAGASDFWCDASIHDNVVRNVVEYPTGGDLAVLNQASAFSTSGETLTMTNPLLFPDCMRVFVNGSGGNLTCGGAACLFQSLNVMNPNYATGTVQLSSSATCASAVDIEGSTLGTLTLQATGGFNTAGMYGQLHTLLKVVDGKEAAIHNNLFDGLRIVQPLTPIKCRSAGVRCEQEPRLGTLLAVSDGGEEVLGYNTLINSSIDGGALVGACQPDIAGQVCPDVGNLLSMEQIPGSGNQLGGAITQRSAINPYQGKWSEITFCGDLAAGVDSTWWLPPISDAAGYAALVDDRLGRLGRPTACAMRLAVTEDAAVVTTVDEPVTVVGDPTLEVIDMTCWLTGDANGTLTFTLQVDGSPVSAFACSIVGGSDFENYCSVAPPVALSTTPQTIAALSAVAVGVNTSAANGGNDASCVVRTRPRL